VPTEPIASYRITGKGEVDVFSGVLDLSLHNWIEIGGYYLNWDLDSDSSKIESILKKNGYTHGHTHHNNFCLRFFRNPDGSVDFSRKPRVYLIDFDQAKSPTVTTPPQKLKSS